MGTAATRPVATGRVPHILRGVPRPTGTTGLPGTTGLRRHALAALIVLATVAACGAGGSATDCGLDGCTVTFPRSGEAAVSVLGVDARLIGVDAGEASLEIAGQAVRVPVGGQTEVQGFLVSVESVTDTEVVVRVTGQIN